MFVLYAPLNYSSDCDESLVNYSEYTCEGSVSIIFFNILCDIATHASKKQKKPELNP